MIVVNRICIILEHATKRKQAIIIAAGIELTIRERTSSDGFWADIIKHIIITNPNILAVRCRKNDCIIIPIKRTAYGKYIMIRQTINSANITKNGILLRIIQRIFFHLNPIRFRTGSQ